MPIKKTKNLTPGEEKISDISTELERILAIKKLFKSSGGEQLITLLRNNCAANMRKLVTLAKEKPELNTLLSVIFDFSSNLDLLMTLGDLNLEEELRTQLDEAVKEAMD